MTRREAIMGFIGLPLTGNRAAKRTDWQLETVVFHGGSADGGERQLPAAVSIVPIHFAGASLWIGGDRPKPVAQQAFYIRTVRRDNQGRTIFALGYPFRDATTMTSDDADQALRIDHA